MQVLFLGCFPSNDYVSERILKDSAWIPKNLPCQVQCGCEMIMELRSKNQGTLFSQFLSCVYMALGARFILTFKNMGLIK